MSDTNKTTKTTTNKMTAQEKQEWDELFQYVKNEIFNYNNNSEECFNKLPPYLIMRLKGLAEGKFYANKKTQKQGKYTYKMILLTFKLCKGNIQQGLISNQTSFKDEKHKVNYIMAIIENNINDVKDRLIKAENSKKAIDRLDTTIYEDMGKKAEYKTKSKINERLRDLW